MGKLSKWLGKLAWKGLRTVGIAKIIGLVGRGYVRLPKLGTVRKEVLDAVDDAREASTETSVALLKIRAAQWYVEKIGDRPPLPKTAIFGIIFAIASPFVLIGFGFLSSALAWQYYLSTQDAERAMTALMWAWGLVGGACIMIPTVLAVALCSRWLWSGFMWWIVRKAQK